MKEIANKTHRDYINIIGGTAFTTKNYREKRWNQYYLSSCIKVVASLLKNEKNRDIILDVGCSHGSWFQTWKQFGFKKIHGVEMSFERAEQAKITGFDQVYNCEASSIPVEDNYYHIACSNGMFIHVLRLEDKLAILNEIHRVLKPDGVFILNFSPPDSFGFNDDTIEKHCSFYTLDTMIREIIVESEFEIEDIKPSYFPDYSIFRKFIGYGIAIPFTVSLLKIHDLIFSKNIQIQSSSTIYFKLRKKSN